jgi:GAF domain-containing protein
VSPVEEDIESLDADIDALLSSSKTSFRGQAFAAGLNVYYDLCGGQFDNLDLSGQDLSGFNFAGASLRGTLLVGVDLARANLIGADLRDADLTNANLRDADLEDADLSDAIVRDVCWHGANVKGIIGLVLRETGMLAEHVPQGDELEDEFGSLFRMIARSLRVESSSDWAIVWRFLEDRPAVRMMAADGMAKDLNAQMNLRSPFVEVLRVGRAVFFHSHVGLSEDGESGPVGRSGAWYVPVIVGRQTPFVLEMGWSTTRTAPRFVPSTADVNASVLVELFQAFGHRKKTKRLLETLGHKTNIAEALQSIVDTARELDQVESSFLLRAPPGAEPSQWYVAASTDPEINDKSGIVERLRRRIGSAVAAPSWATEDLGSGRAIWATPVAYDSHLLGALTVCSRRELDPSGLQMLKSLANGAAIVLGWPRTFSRFLDEIDAGVEALGKTEDLARDIALKLAGEFKSVGVAVDLLNWTENVLDTVATSVPSEAGTRYPLTDDPELRSIQVDVARSGRGRIVPEADTRSPPTPRSSPIAVRMLLPLVIFTDGAGNYEAHAGDQCAWRASEEKGQRFIDHHCPGGFEPRVLGVLEVKCPSPWTPKMQAVVRSLGAETCRAANLLYRSMLQFALERSVHTIHGLARSDSATLHFLRMPESRPGGDAHVRYLAEVAAGERGARFITKLGQLGRPPRNGGIGMRALSEGKIQICSGDELELCNPNIYGEGVRTMVAVPLATSHQRGVLYLHYNQERRFAPEDLSLIEILTKRVMSAASWAENHALTRERERLLRGISQMSLSLMSLLTSTRSTSIGILKELAESTLKLFGADVITVYEYDGTRQAFAGMPIISGRLSALTLMGAEISRADVPHRLVQLGQNLYVSDVESEATLRGSREGRPDFVEREGIRSCAAILLPGEHGVAVIGIMFVNFRRRKDFALSERSIMELIASSASLLIRHRRDLEGSKRNAVLPSVEKELKDKTRQKLKELFEGYSVVEPQESTETAPVWTPIVAPRGVFREV